MKGDFTRDTFHAAKRFTRVLMQQGRVTLDADHNEQAAILLHHFRTLTKDLLGPFATPRDGGGFRLSSSDEGGFRISPGRYYVGGLLVENDREYTYLTQPDFPVPPDDPLAEQITGNLDGMFWIYLDVWERHITSLEDPAIREVALGGPDTCTRAKVVWQVKALPIQLNGVDTLPGAAAAPSCMDPLSELIPLSNALLRARIDPGEQESDPCVTSPDSKYRGAENHLYRVEIHHDGDAATATFKWSRENGSIATAWLGTSGNDLEVASARGFASGNWVELIDDTLELLGLPGTLVKLTKVEGNRLSVDPESYAGTDTISWKISSVNPKIRCWNQTQNEDIVLREGAIPVDENAGVWLDLEDGVQIQFLPGGQYRTGDYWLIPARVATGNIEWPEGTDAQPSAQSPHGIEHHYAPLGFVRWNDGQLRLRSCRCEFDPIDDCHGSGSIAVGARLVRVNATESVVTRSPSRAPRKRIKPS